VFYFNDGFCGSILIHVRPCRRHLYFQALNRSLQYLLILSLSTSCQQCLYAGDALIVPHPVQFRVLLNLWRSDRKPSVACRVLPGAVPQLPEEDHQHRVIVRTAA